MLWQPHVDITMPVCGSQWPHEFAVNITVSSANSCSQLWPHVNVVSYACSCPPASIFMVSTLQLMLRMYCTHEHIASTLYGNMGGQLPWGQKVSAQQHLENSNLPGHKRQHHWWNQYWQKGFFFKVAGLQVPSVFSVSPVISASPYSRQAFVVFFFRGTGNFLLQF